MVAPRPRVFTIPPSARFLPTLIGALTQGRLVPGFPASGDPLALASATIYLPTQRACRLARDLFLDALGHEAALLPRLAAIGDIDDEELIFADAAGALGGHSLDLPDAIEGLERKLLLAQLILRWAQSPELHGASDTPLVANTPTAAMALAEALARLIDDMTTRGVPWSQLDKLVPDHVDVYWQLTLRFLKVAREGWPAILAERERIEPAAKRDKLIAAETARLVATQDGPVIAAGSTASMPATALLLSTIARLPHGAVVLPGLDMDLDEPSWQMIDGVPVGSEGRRRDANVGHPQYAMQGFLRGLDMHRVEVETLVAPATHGREKLVSEALRPAAATEHWNERLPHEGIGAALGAVALIEAANAEEEALAIAVALREAVETPAKTAALVTPDRALARRVMAALKRWNVAVDDSGGDPLADTQAGIFARLSAEAALGGLAPVTLLALLKHPLTRLGADAGARAEAVSVLERALLRGPRPRRGTQGLTQALVNFRVHRGTLHRADPRAQLGDADLDLAMGLVERLRAALSRLENVPRQPLPLSELVARHRDVLTALSLEGEQLMALSGDDGEMLSSLLEMIAESDAAATFIVSTDDYVDLLELLMAGGKVRQPPRVEARVRVFGLLEARLQDVDRIVLGELVEGIWPPLTRSDPWLSRPMRETLGLDPPERRIGLTAHDFAQSLGCPEVVLSRAAKLAGAPTVPSRFLQRLAAVAGKGQWDAVRARGEKYLVWARALYHPRTPPRRIKPPSPKPPLAARPTRLSVTEIEHWLRDPYTIYAKHILRLLPLDPVDTPPGARDRGSAVHKAIEEFAKLYQKGLPADPLKALLEIGHQAFAPLQDFPETQAFWWPRFERVARFYVDWERRRRPGLEAVRAELSGKLEIPFGARTFTLAARADRIEHLGGNAYALLDFKTGQAATARQVRQGLAPQLTLEAAMVQQGGFKEIAAGAHIAAFGYVLLKGGEPAGEEQPIEWKDTSAEDEARKAFERLRALVRRFENENEPYRSLQHPMWSTRYGDYDHLARVKEWSESGDSSDGEGPA
jgi:ATP-dependent helicase/nuclease subunit B